MSKIKDRKKFRLGYRAPVMRISAKRMELLPDSALKGDVKIMVRPADGGSCVYLRLKT